MSESRDRGHASAFTLIEVLAAVAVLGISYILLATVVMQGLRMTGESERRLHASLLADNVLAELELRVATGGLLDPGEEEEEKGIFKIRTEILDLEVERTAENRDPESTDLLDFFAEESNSPHAVLREGNWLLAYLREIHIQVMWKEGVDEKKVTRTSYLWDQNGWGQNAYKGGAGGGGGASDDGDDGAGGAGDGDGGAGGGGDGGAPEQEATPFGNTAS